MIEGEVKLGTRMLVHLGRLERTIQNEPSRWREGYEEVEVIGETRVSWFIGKPGSEMDAWGVHKVKKKEMATAPGFYSDWEQVEKSRWVSENYYALGDAVRRCSDYDKLRAVAEIIGYEEKKGG